MPSSAAAPLPAVCAVHPERRADATCARCGNFRCSECDGGEGLCVACRTRAGGVPGTCPKCHSTESKAVGFSWWGGALGPKMFHHVKCAVCGSGYNVQTGKSNNRAIALYVLVTNVIGFGLLALFWANR